MDNHAALKHIQGADPDGGETEPSADDYARHRQWAIATSGEKVWDIYRHADGY